MKYIFRFNDVDLISIGASGDGAHVFTNDEILVTTKARAKRIFLSLGIPTRMIDEHNDPDPDINVGNNE